MQGLFVFHSVRLNFRMIFALSTYVRILHIPIVRLGEAEVFRGM